MAGKLDDTTKEMERMNMHIFDVSEVRWPNDGKIKSNSHQFIIWVMTTHNITMKLPSFYHKISINR